jgi:two-component system, NtrC family, sensor kinase
MKLATKLALAISAVFALVLLASGAFLAEDEIEFVDAQVARHGRLLGRVISSSVSETWRDRGEADARELLRSIDAEEEAISVRWVSLTAPTASDPTDAFVDDTARARLRGGETWSVIGGVDEDTRYTYAPVLHDGHDSAIEIAQPLRARSEHVRGIIMLLLGLGLLGFGTSTLMAYALGRRYVGRPVAELISVARRVGEGDRSTRASETGTDELAALAQEMNAMVERLSGAEERAAELDRTRRRAQRQLEHAERLATVGQLAAGVAHEIGTPLQAITTHARLIAARAGHVEGVEVSARTIEAQSHEVAHSIRNLLGLARRAPARSQRRDLRTVLREAVALVQAAYPSDRSSIELELPPDPLHVEADAEQLAHVVTNLLINGMHAMPHGGRLVVGAGTITTHRPDEPDAAARPYGCIWIEDQGVGIPDDVLPHVFEPFFTTKPAGEGTGLGLSIVRGIVREHGGWIDVRTRSGEGTRFTIHLPIADVGQPPSDRDSEVPG